MKSNRGLLKIKNKGQNKFLENLDSDHVVKSEEDKNRPKKKIY